MSTCSRCGDHVEFRYIDGHCIPLHLSGGCGGRSGSSDVRDFSGFVSSNESECFQTHCPSCNGSVFFIRHNGGSVWVEPPLGPPWLKHACMEDEPTNGDRIRASLIFPDELATYDSPEGLLIGVVKAAETAASCTILQIESGASETLFLLIKNNAGFLVGRIVVVDPSASVVRWIENASYTFSIIAPLRAGEKCVQQRVNASCPECDDVVRIGNLARHLRRVHGFTIMQARVRTP